MTPNEFYTYWTKPEYNLRPIVHFVVPLFGSYFFIGCQEASTENLPVSELDTISFENLSQKAYGYLYARQDSCERQYKIVGYKNWYYDQYTGKLTFSDSGITKLSIDTKKWDLFLLDPTHGFGHGRTRTLKKR